ncbi:hypothetical protein A8B83_13890 [Rhodobacteraceae bacterium EhC02]|nr:hypothetical protein A8B83_13890 [Rhodobacteraceae bacterium EhC02]
MNYYHTHVAALALVGLVAVPASADQTFSILQELPAITHVDIGAQGSSHGDIMAFEADFTADDGTSGEMHGVIITVSIPVGENDVFLDRIAQIVVNFGSTDTLVIAGTAAYPAEQAEMAPDSPHVRAVIGGTGRFIGARGQMVTTRRDAGHYEHTFTLVD